MTDIISSNYYDTHAEEYFNQTRNVDMTNAYTRFIQRLPKNASIIDLGAGSGRDLLFFRNNGFYIEGIDSSEQLCELARYFSNCNVKCCSIQAWYPKEKYTGIWANASLLHLTEQELLLFWKRVPDILIENGLIYFSMKKGIMTGFDNMGRYFTDFSDRLEVAMFELVPNMVVVDSWESMDQLQRTDFKWVNYICQKLSGS